MRENASTVGPIGRAYRVWGDGKQMADGFDPEDYFGVPDAAAEGNAPCCSRRSVLTTADQRSRDTPDSSSPSPDVKGWSVSR